MLVVCRLAGLPAQILDFGGGGIKSRSHSAV
jgi:hypothetical protein